MRNPKISMFLFVLALTAIGCTSTRGVSTPEPSLSKDGGTKGEQRAAEKVGERPAPSEEVYPRERTGDAGVPGGDMPQEALVPEVTKESPVPEIPVEPSLLPKAQRTGLIRLRDPLDEPDSYCLDVPGYKSTLKLDSPLMVHTCKTRNADDETFVMDEPRPGKIYLKVYDRCVEAGRSTGRTKAYTRACRDSPLQQFVLTAAGELQLKQSNPPLCLVVEDGVGTVAGGVSNLRRNLWLDLCKNAKSKLKVWDVPGGKLGP